jgi:alpha/beta superfamily hydrolase
MEEQMHVIKGKLGKLRGIIHKPVLPSKGIVILIHGYFTSNKLGPANLFVQIARIFAGFGYDFWRFDCYGIGDSDGDFDNSTYELRIDDYMTIIKSALKQHNNILLLGYSAGTSIAVRLANICSSIKVLFLLAPSFGKITWHDNLLPKEIQILLHVQGFAYRKSQLIHSDFIEQITSEEIFDEIKKCGAKFILFYGMNDEYFDLCSINHAISYMKNKKLVKIPESDHNFLYNRSILFEQLNFEILHI